MPQDRKRTIGVQFQTQKRAVVASLTFIYLPSIALLFIVGMIGLLTPIDPSSLMQDTTAAAHVPFYFGALSTIGIFMWCGAATACMLTYTVLRRSKQEKHVRRFFLWYGVLGTVLLFDDAFLFHETIGPRYLGIPGPLTYAIYGISFVLIISFYWHFFVKSDFIPLLIGAAFLAASVLIDIVHDILFLHFYASSFFEDGCKFLGIAGWFSYFTILSVKQLSKSIRQSNVVAQSSVAPYA